MEPIRVAFLLYPQVTQLDFTGPAQLLSRLGNARVDYVWKSREPVPTDAGFSVLPTATFAEVARADILCVPGGIACVDMMEDEEVLAWVARVGERASWVTSVCTGSLILGAAGLLDGYRAACHWAWREHLALFGAEPVAERVVLRPQPRHRRRRHRRHRLRPRAHRRDPRRGPCAPRPARPRI